MAKVLKVNNHLFATLLLATVVLVKSLPTSVLVDTKQQHHAEHTASDSLASSKEKESAPSATKSSASLEHENPISTNRPQTKLHAQKRGVKPNIFDRDLSNDILINNNVPNGVWEDSDAGILYPDLQELEDYQAYQQPFTSPYHQRPYDNLQHILNADNLYEEPLALPVIHQYPRYLDERRKRGINKNIMRLKRDSTKLNTADMLALLAFLEANQHNNRYNNENDDINSLEYPKQYYGSPYGNADLEDDDAVNGGEWWNEYIEPSVQYYGSPYGHIEQNPRERLTNKVFPVKRFMVSKKKRSTHSLPEESDSGKSNHGTGFDRRYTGGMQLF